MLKLGPHILLLALSSAACGSGQRASSNSDESSGGAGQTTGLTTGATANTTGSMQTTGATGTSEVSSTHGTDGGSSTTDVTFTEESATQNSSTTESGDVEGADEALDTSGDSGCFQPCYSEGVFIQCCTADEICQEGKCRPDCATQIRCGPQGELCCDDGEFCFERETCVALTTPCQTDEDCQPDEYCERAVDRCAPRPNSDCPLTSPRPPAANDQPGPRTTDLIAHAELDPTPCELRPSALDVVIGIENRGPLGVHAGIAVDLFSVEEQLVHIAQLRTERPLLPGETGTLVHRIEAPGGQRLPDLYIVVDGPQPQDGQVDECDEDNNDVELSDVYCILPR